MPKRLPVFFGAPDESAGYLLWQATNLWHRRQRKALAPLGLTPVQFFLLAGVVWLTREGAPVTQRQLARHVRTDAMTTSQVIRSLQARKLIRRNDDPRDSRAYALLASAAGRKLARAAAFAMKEANEDFFEGVGGDSGRLRAMLEQVTSDNRPDTEADTSNAS